MSDHTKVFEYQVNGLSYTVTVYEENGTYYADILVNEGAMDVNAVYLGDDDYSGSSVSLNGPLNMNGAGAVYDRETVQWDDAIKLSDPGLGKIGVDKETYLTEGETLKVELPIDSLDDLDIFGIRATSTSTDSGSIKAVSGDPTSPEEPDEPTFEKVFFDYGLDETGSYHGGYYILSEEPENNEYHVPSLPEGTEPTFENYISYFEEIGGDLSQVESVVFYDTDEDGTLHESFRIDAPEGGFADANALLDAYDAALEEMENSPDMGTPDTAALELMGALSTSTEADDMPDTEEAEDVEEVAAF